MIILTGGAGFIGSAMLRKLNDNGVDNVVVVDHLGSSDKWKNLIGKKFLDYIPKDQFLERLERGNDFNDTQAVVHFGACSSTMEQDADYLMQNNYAYSRKLAEWAVARNIRFIYASSAATYGDGTAGFLDDDETTARLHPLNKYGFSKHLFDLWILDRHLQSRVTGLKFFNVFGPNEYHKQEMRSLVNKAFFQIRDTGTLKLFKSHKPEYQDGEQVRDFVYVKDCTEIIWWLMKNPAVGGIFNLGSGRARSWNDLAGAIFSAMGLPRSIEYIDMPASIRDAYQYRTEAPMEKLKAAGCPVAFAPLEASVKDYVQNYLAAGGAHL